MFHLLCPQSGRSCWRCQEPTIKDFYSPASHSSCQELLLGRSLDARSLLRLHCLLSPCRIWEVLSAGSCAWPDATGAWRAAQLPWQGIASSKPLAARSIQCPKLWTLASCSWTQSDTASIRCCSLCKSCWLPGRSVIICFPILTETLMPLILVHKCPGAHAL